MISGVQLGEVEDAVMLFHGAFQVARRIAVSFAKAQSHRAKFRAEYPSRIVAAQVNELGHRQAEVVVALSHVAFG